MLNIDEIQPHWIAGFATLFELCKIAPDEQVIILSETASSPLHVHLAKLGLGQIGRHYTHLELPSIPDPTGPIVRSSGATQILGTQPLAVRMMCEADIIIDISIEGLMHASQTGKILKSGTRIMNISAEHPDVLCRLLPTPEMKDIVKEAVSHCREAHQMLVNSEDGTELTVDMGGAASVGIWGWTDRAGTLAHWPGGIVVSFPQKNTVNGRLVMAPGDMNLSFKRYIESEVILNISDDYITSIEGNGADARLMRDYLAGFDSKEAYATSHVGWGLNRAARYEALSIYDNAQTNGTELRAVAGNFLYSTGANEFAGRFTRGHFDLPMMGCDIRLDDRLVVSHGKLVS